MDNKELRGKPVADHIKEGILNRVKFLNQNNIVPRFLLLRLGNKENDLSYEKAILKNCEKLGIDVIVDELDENISQRELIKKLEEPNSDPNIHGIMFFRPLPEHLDEREVALNVNPEKDVDAINPINLGKTFEGAEDGFAPCTPKAVIEMLKFNNIDLQGKNVVVIGRSLVVGKPVSMLFIEENATVTICHSKSKDIKEITRRADIVVTALGRAKALDESYFTEDSIIVDVGVNVDENGRLCGDVDFDGVYNKVKAITPVPGGVGSITTTILMDHIVTACENLSKK